ncbi:SusD family outer membrane lipoprotein NanU [Paludibacter sp.]
MISNMKNILTLIIAAVFSSILFMGCEDFLNVKQIDILYNEVFWENEQDVQQGVLGVYSLYRGLMVSPMNWYERGDVTTGFFRRGWNGGSSDKLYLLGNFEDLNGQKSWGDIEYFANWGQFYKVIAMANLAIKKIEGMPESKISAKAKNKYLGETYFLRGLTYFHILRIWGNAPFIDDAIESSNQVINSDLTPVLIPRTSDIEIGKHVIEDVDKAISMLEYGIVGSAEWGIRANKGSAEALMGHTKMWMYFLAQRDNLSNADDYLTGAITALESVVNNGNYTLMPYDSEQDIIKLYDGQSSEAVFELNVSTQSNESFRADYGGITSITCKFVPLNGNKNLDKSSSVNFIPFSQKTLIYPEFNIVSKTGDKRANLFFGAWDSPYDEAFSDVSPIANNRDLVTWMKKYAIMTEDALKSWDEHIAYFAEANIPVFRFTDIYLLLAEAYCKNNQQGKALPIVRAIRTRAGLGEYVGSNLEKEVLQQRVSELIGEGQIYYDMVRNNWFPNASVMDPSRYTQKGYYWPIAGSILTENKLVSQTPYWNGKTKW